MLDRDEKISSTKMYAAQYAIVLVFLVLGFGLWRLQILGSERFEQMAERNRIRTIPILAPRGKILDREGRTIVDNYPSFSALLLRDQPQNVEGDLEKIAAGLHIPPEGIREQLRRVRTAPRFQPIIIKDDIAPDELAFIESHRNELPQLETIMVHRRLYPKNGFAAHLIGYVGEVSEEMLNMAQYELNTQGDIVGRSGVEGSYNDLLIGKNGSRRVLVDSRGKEVGRLSKDPALPGKQLRLSIDLDLQMAAEQALEGKNGAIVALDPRNGEVLAMVSRPTFDPNEFAVHISRSEWSALITDEAKPLLNKAIQAQLAPGSVFKIIMSVAGLQEGVAQNMRVNCGGGGTFYGRYFKCWVVAEHRTHGIVEISKAIFQSCDTFFYTLAERLGIGRIAKYAQAFGLGQRTGIDLPQEVTGVMPSEEWKAKLFKQKWFAGETISVGIGQGAITATPIQLARAIGGIASGGRLHRPHVAMQDQLPEEFRLKDNTGEAQVQIDPVNWEIITDAMADVLNPIGTAPSAHLEGIDFAGKTGSAQVVSNTMKSKLGGGRSLRDNGWFAGVTPRRNPEIVVAVLIEQGEHGYLAARIASQVIKAYVLKQRRSAVKTASASGVADEQARPVEVAGVWGDAFPQTEGGELPMKAGRFEVVMGDRLAARPARRAGPLREMRSLR